MALIKLGILKCDCDNPASHLDKSGQPECDRCEALNHKAIEFHERTRNLLICGPLCLSQFDV
jgi:hypothetical protein